MQTTGRSPASLGNGGPLLLRYQGIVCANNAPASEAANALETAFKASEVKYSAGTMLNILQQNIMELRRKLMSFNDFYEKRTHTIQIACLQDPKLSKIMEFMIKGYAILRKVRKDGAGNGLSALIKTP
ncbi:hypothetical protein CDAR_13631 [Caerostris darwini]|uniref:Uncharacterized protein n=1 Tax=Caerostris darwini TaxID=1538125 RepID=A0AAV4MXC0_9ARAC|nr:hypothetical protein CDAR_13631 [Caerostris darwini]